MVLWYYYAYLNAQNSENYEKCATNQYNIAYGP